MSTEMWHAVQPERSVPVALEGTEHHFRQVERHSIEIFRGKRPIPMAIDGLLHGRYCRTSGFFISKQRDPLTFFMDRSVGKRFVPEALRQAGAQVHLHDDYFDPMIP